MFFDVYMIILTAFAVFGFFCLTETVFFAISAKNYPQSVTVMAYSEDECTAEKVIWLRENMPSGSVLLVQEKVKNENIYTDTDVCGVCEISEYITDVLFTKNSC